jgi:hypothetical protein
MQIQPLVKVKKAANLLGVDKAELTRRLSTGEVKGECRTVGARQKWFIYSGELDTLLVKERFGGTPAERVSVEDMAEFFEAGETQQSQQDSSDAAAEESPPPSAADLKEAVELTAQPALRRRTRRQKPTLPDSMYISNMVEVEDVGLTMPTTVHIDRDAAPNTVTVENLPALSGESSFEAVVHSLSMEFAYRLAEERQRVLQLEMRLEEQQGHIQQLQPLQNALQLEVRNGCMKDLEIKSLQASLAALTEKVEGAKPWWKRLLAAFIGDKAA